MQVHSLNSLRRFALQRRANESPEKVSQSSEQVVLSESARKEVLIAQMIRISPGEEESRKMVEALSLLPLEALNRISEFGTRIEIFDKHAQNLPLYAQKLTKKHLAGAYSPTANVVFVDKEQITPRILVHEAMHALDEAVGGASRVDPWTTARNVARQSRQFIRPYASHNSAEYFADNLAASLFSKEKLVATLAQDLQEGNGTEGLSREHIVADHAHYHREGQAEVDPLASKLCQKFWSVLEKYPKAKPRPALSPDEYRNALLEMRDRMKGS